MHDESHDAADADRRCGKGRMQSGLLQVAHIDRGGAQCRRGNQRREISRDLRHQRARHAQLLWDESCERPGRRKVRDQAEESGRGDPPPIGIADESDEIHLGQLGQQDVPGDGAGHHHDEGLGFDALELDCFFVCSWSYLDQSIAQRDDESLVLAQFFSGTSR